MTDGSDDEPPFCVRAYFARIRHKPTQRAAHRWQLAVSGLAGSFRRRAPERGPSTRPAKPGTPS